MLRVRALGRQLCCGYRAPRAYSIVEFSSFPPLPSPPLPAVWLSSSHRAQMYLERERGRWKFSKMKQDRWMKFSKREREKERELEWTGSAAPFHSYTRYARSFSFRVKIFSRATFLVDNVEIFVNYDPQFQRPVYTTVYCDNIGGGGQNLSHFGSGIERFLKSITPILRCFLLVFFFWYSCFVHVE